jgi:hypothetical protein
MMGRAMATTRFKIATLVLAVLAASAAVAAAELSATGNAQAIAFDRAAVAAENRAPGYAVTQRGLITMRSTLAGGKHSVKLSWGTGTIKPGWTAVAERLTFAQQDGLIAWITDDLTPLCIRGSDCKANLPIELVTNFYGAYLRFATSSSPCFYVAAGVRSPYPDTEVPWWSVGGDFLGPPARHGADTVLTYTYPYGKTRVAEETDTIITRTKAFRTGVVRVANGRRARPPWAFTIRAHFTQLRHAPPAPTVTECPSSGDAVAPARGPYPTPVSSTGVGSLRSSR